jgi:hypothetical protein
MAQVDPLRRERRVADLEQPLRERDSSVRRRRRGWLFAGTVEGAQASANLYSSVETCKAVGIDPYCYLGRLFRRLPLATTVDDYDTLLPWNMPADIC